MVKKSGQTLITGRLSNSKSKLLTKRLGKKRRKQTATPRLLMKTMTDALPDWARKP
jgi:hypothetical protein